MFGDHVDVDCVVVEAKLASSLDTVIRYRYMLRSWNDSWEEDECLILNLMPPKVFNKLQTVGKASRRFTELLPLPRSNSHSPTNRCPAQ